MALYAATLLQRARSVARSVILTTFRIPETSTARVADWATENHRSRVQQPQRRVVDVVKVWRERVPGTYRVIAALIIFNAAMLTLDIFGALCVHDLGTNDARLGTCV